MRKDLQKRVIFGGIALAFFIPVVLMGGLVFQIVVGLIAMLGVHELLKMKGLQTETIEGALAMLVGAAFRELPSLLASRWQFYRLWPFGLIIDGDDCLGTRLHL